MKRKSLAVLLLLPVALCTVLINGCSYKAIDDAIHNVVDPNAALTGAPVEAVTVPDDGYTYIEVGESLPDYYKFSYADFGEPNLYAEQGYKGLVYTINKATVYDSVIDSPISPEDCEPIWYDENDALAYEKNAFILVDITATYNNESGNPDFDEIMFRMELEGFYRWGEGYKKYADDFFIQPYTDPTRIYFSERPLEGDVDLDGREIDLESDSNVCRKPLKSGESIDFQIGILTKQELIDDKNVFLYMRAMEPPEKGNPIYAVDLLGRFKQ